MKKYLALGLALVVLTTGTAHAQIMDLSAPSVPSCISLSSYLGYRSTDLGTRGQVSELQNFLRAQGYFNQEPTGFYGKLTVYTVSNFQRDNGINPTGGIGPITRAKINIINCSGDSLSTSKYPTPSPSTLLTPTNGCSGAALYSSTTGKPCSSNTPTYTYVPPFNEAQPSISQFGLGLTAAKVGEETAIYGQNLFDNSTVTFTGGAIASSVRTFAGDRIIVVVPPGAQNGPIKVCNGLLCSTTQEDITILKDLSSNASIHVQTPSGGETWKIGGTYQVWYSLTNIDTTANPIMVYLENPNSESLIGQTTNNQKFEFPLDSRTTGGYFKIKVCEWPRCSISATNNGYITITN